MSVESVDLEGALPSGVETDVEESLSLDWNGRSVSEVQPNQRIEEIRETVFLNHIVAKGFVQTTYTFSFIEQGDFSGNRRSDFILCGASVDGEVSVSGSIDTEGNKSAEVEVEVSSKDGNISGSVSGSVSQDSSGHTQGSVEVKGTFSF